jgi:hypothetical protein
MEDIYFYDELDKAVDWAIWLNFTQFNDKLPKYGVIDGPEENYAVVREDHPFMDEFSFIENLPQDYSHLDFNHLKAIGSDFDPLPHWASIKGAFDTMKTRYLLFILDQKVPLEKFIRYTLASRGYDQKAEWIGFEKAEKLWLESKTE